jgi:integrase
VLQCHARARLLRRGPGLLSKLENQGLKRSTLRGYRSLLGSHLIPLFGPRAVDRIKESDVAALDRTLREASMKPQSRRNVLGLLGAVLETARKKGWAAGNPVAEYEKPRKARSEPDELRFLTLEDLEAVIRTMPEDELGRVERALVLTAAMTGMRRGELLGERVALAFRRMRRRARPTAQGESSSGRRSGRSASTW